ncbi:MAG: acyl-CoA thioesterase [Chloroflexota bacterium]
MSMAEPAHYPARHVILSQIMLPSDANAHGNVHGGTLMKLADTAGAIAAVRHARSRVVTAVMDSMTFEYPVSVGQLVLLDATVTWVGRTSIETEVVIEAEDVVSGDRHRVSTSFFVFVALDEQGQPREVPRLDLHTDRDRLHFQQAEERRAFRLAQRSAHRES